MKKFHTILAIVILILPGAIQAQNIFPSNGSTGIGTITPDASSILEMNSTSKGMLIPRMTRTQRDAIASPATGLMIYQTNSTTGFYFYDGSTWKQMAPAGVNKTLSNLNTPTAINVDLLPNAAASRNLGSYQFTWKDAYLDGTVYSNGFTFISHPGTSNTFIGNESGLADSIGSYNTGTGAYSLGVNSSGNYNTASGYASLYLNTTGIENSAFGAGALFTNSIGTYNTAVGSSSLRLNTFGLNNAAVGAYSLYNNTSGADNVAIGRSSLYSNSTGYKNTAAGSGAMYNNTSAVSSTAIGYHALYSATTNGGNTATGSEALYNATGSDNTAIGFQALYSNTSGTGNAAGGAHALAGNTTGAGNSAFGPYAGNSANTSSFCSFFGYNASQTVNMVFTNSMALGYDANITASNQARIGNSSVNSIGGYANWTNISDGRFKKNIKQNVPGLAFINKLKPVTYNLDITGLRQFLKEDISYDEDGKKLSAQPDEKMKQAIDKKEKQIQTGFVAQDVEKAAKELGYDFSGVDKPENESSPYGLRYSEFVVPLVKAVQELSQQNDELKKQIDAQQKVNTDLQKQINDLKVLVATGKASSSATVQQINPVSQTGRLEQNQPNPTSSATVIKYFVPGDVSHAAIRITNANGQEIKSIDLSVKNNGQINLQGGALAAGTYFYSLIIDGKMADTKKMVIIH